ncbi:MAG: fatty acid desaturase [Anaerolineaceae bacterium]|nr:fatty acid desaturase [Anaerolineaceae bacterium]
MNPKSFPQEPLPTMAELNRILAPYQKADIRHSVFQLANTLIPYFILWYLMVRAFAVSYWLTLPLAVVAGLFLVRIFIFFHDCGHNSFFPSKRLNKLVGFWLGVLVFTPGEQWWHSHAIHHATSGNLDKRGVGDVEMLTQEEYLQARWSKKLGYRFFRNPLVMFGLGPIFMFLLMARLALPSYGKKEKMSVVWTNLAILAVGVIMSLLVGWKAYLLIQLPVIWIAGGLGIWMFYLQHQFEESYWERDPEWNYVASALLGASFYKLPALMQWFTGSIGYHHIHHLSPRIPNYNLEKAHETSPLIQHWTRQINFGEGWRTVRMKVWNEATRHMSGFPRGKSVMKQQVRQTGD